MEEKRRGARKVLTIPLKGKENDSSCCALQLGYAEGAGQCPQGGSGLGVGQADTNPRE